MLSKVVLGIVLKSKGKARLLGILLARLSMLLLVAWVMLRSTITMIKGLGSRAAIGTITVVGNKQGDVIVR